MNASAHRLRRLVAVVAITAGVVVSAAPAATDGELLARASRDWQCQQATVAGAVTDGMLLSRAAREIR